MAHSMQSSPRHVTSDSGCQTFACGVLPSLVLVQGKWALQLHFCPTASAGMRSQGGVLSKMLAWLGQALWVFLSAPSLAGDRMGGGAGREHCLPSSSPLGPFNRGLEIESAK